jgi:hypothetical protein
LIKLEAKYNFAICFLQNELLIITLELVLTVLLGFKEDVPNEFLGTSTLKLNIFLKKASIKILSCENF